MSITIFSARPGVIWLVRIHYGSRDHSREVNILAASQKLGRNRSWLWIPEGRLFHPARPKPQPSMGDWDAARFQPSAFSTQLLNKHRGHAFDLGGLLCQLFTVPELDQFQISSQEEMIFQLAG